MQKTQKGAVLCVKKVKPAAPCAYPYITASVADNMEYRIGANAAGISRVMPEYAEFLFLPVPLINAPSICTDQDCVIANLQESLYVFIAKTVVLYALFVGCEFISIGTVQVDTPTVGAYPSVTLPVLENR